MKTLTVLAGVLLAVNCVLAAPARVIVEELEEVPVVPPVPILKQINEVHDDGSYTFGFEAGDGSFRVETKSVSGEIKGKYGYIDEFGVQQVLEYNTGKASGKSLGFQTGGNLAPFPIVRSVSSPEQRARDYEYSSTDEDEDGMPDYKQHHYAGTAQKQVAYPQTKKAYAHPPAAKQSYDSYDSYDEHEPAVVHVEPVVRIAPAPVVRVAPAPVPVVRVAPAPVVRVAAPVPLAPLVRVAPAPIPVGRGGGQPVAIANPDAQFFEDLANDSIDANQDGEPDRVVGVFQQPAPVVFGPPPGAPFFDGRRFI